MLLIFLTSLGIRLLFVNPDNENVTLFRDEQEYVQYAHNLIRHGVFSRDPSTSNPVPDAYRSPGYPMLIALSMVAGGSSGFLSVLFYTQAVMSALLAPLTFLAGNLFLPLPAAFAAALLVVLSPHLITTAPCVLSETLFAFLLLSAVCAYLYASVHKNKPLYIMSAVIFGFAFLVNEIAFFLPIIFAVIYLVLHPGRWKNLMRSDATRMVCLFLLVFALFPGGWMLRNALFLPPNAERGSDRAVTALSHGAYPDFIYKDVYFKRFPYREDPEQPAFGSSFGQFTRILSKRVSKQPIRYISWYLFGKPVYLWRWSILQGVGDIYIFPLSGDLFEVSPSAGVVKKIMQVIHPWLLSLVAAGMLLLLHRAWKQSVSCDAIWLPMHCFAVCIYATVLYMVFAPWPRYSIPFRPELYLCALWTVSDLVHRVQRFRLRRA